MEPKMTELYSSAAEHPYTFVDAHGNDVTAEVYAEVARIEAERHEKALEARARRAAKSAGFWITKSRARNLTHENHGGFQIWDAMSGFPVAGHWFEYSAQDVIDYFAA
jgi:hypothetical protein